MILHMLPLEKFYNRAVYYLMFTFNPLLGLNLGTFLAGMLIGLRVTGLIPVRPLRFTTANVPKPANATFLLCFNAVPTAEMNASKHSLQVDLGNLDTFAICSTNFALFIQHPLRFVRR